jgi:tetratricopeptide (TPR) repeat protein
VLLTAAGAETISYQGAWKDDSTFYRRALLFTPRNDRVLVNLGVTDLQEGKMGEGMDLLKRALEIKPDNAFALYDLGNAAWNSNDLPAAESYFQQAVDLEAHANWWVMLADAKYRLGKLAETEMAAQRAIALNSSEPGAHLLLGAALLDGGNPAAAASEFNLELSYHPGEASAQQALQIAEQKLGGRID